VQLRAAADPDVRRETKARSRRILHVIMRMDRGGIETSLMQLLRTIDRQRYQMDFLALNPQPGAQDDDVRALGSRIIVAPDPRKPWRLASQFGRILRAYGPYDVIHSHVHLYGGLVLRLAARHGVPLRIAHSRNDTRVAERGRGWPRRAYVWLMRRWLRQHANFRVAISRPAAEDLFGPGWEGDDRFRMIYSGRDFSRYATPEDRDRVRRSLGLPLDALVLGHVGRFYWRKNHAFVLEVAAALFRHQPRARLLLVGDGPDQAMIEAHARTLGIADRVVFAGDRADVSRLLKGSMDVFVFPSRHEGLGMAVVEAQAAGLPCVIATTIPEEVDVVPELIHRMPLAAPAELWAERILVAAAAPRPGQEEALRAVCASDFDIQRSAARLLEIYDKRPEAAPGAAKVGSSDVC
jgi:glycosyltransferase involved in cell wall biosynthesis